ncbi:MAG: MarR family transcriptional regulator [Gammaproteobacteria bacterium]|nr:MarR family transcriptional regulator [Gammaproteobacteria bacterium]|tara:strand:+ start:713 stop:1183 length:471 start_codon:yes stop_codon:yes gene_type:complete
MSDTTLDELNSKSTFPPDESIAYLAREITRIYTRDLQNAIAVHGVLIGQYHFLRVLWERDQITQRELANAVGLKESTTFTALAGMEKQGLLTRKRDSDDRRKMTIKLTDKGRALRSNLIPAAKAVNDRPLTGLNPNEIFHLKTVLGKLRDNLTGDV